MHIPLPPVFLFHPRALSFLDRQICLALPCLALPCLASSDSAPPLTMTDSDLSTCRRTSHAFAWLPSCPNKYMLTAWPVPLPKYLGGPFSYLSPLASRRIGAPSRPAHFAHACLCSPALSPSLSLSSRFLLDFLPVAPPRSMSYPANTRVNHR
jgi:hypothetical protein